jgi:hypothetical protein
MKSPYFHIFAIISPMKGRGYGLSFEKNFNLFHPRMICIKFGRNWSISSGEEIDKMKCLHTDRLLGELPKILTTVHTDGENTKGTKNQ